jgi:hypothetical protein
VIIRDDLLGYGKKKGNNNKLFKSFENSKLNTYQKDLEFSEIYN